MQKSAKGSYENVHALGSINNRQKPGGELYKRLCANVCECVLSLRSHFTLLLFVCLFLQIIPTTSSNSFNYNSIFICGLIQLISTIFSWSRPHSAGKEEEEERRSLLCVRWRDTLQSNISDINRIISVINNTFCLRDV